MQYLIGAIFGVLFFAGGAFAVWFVGRHYINTIIDLKTKANGKAQTLTTYTSVMPKKQPDRKSVV